MKKDLYLHLKTGQIYCFEALVTNAGKEFAETMVLYHRQGNKETKFVREYTDFKEKFKKL